MALDASSLVFVNPRLRRVDALGTPRFYLEDKANLVFELSLEIQQLLERCRVPVAAATLFGSEAPDSQVALQRLVELSILLAEGGSAASPALRVEKVRHAGFGACHLDTESECAGSIVMLGASTDAGTLPRYARGASSGPTEIRRGSEAYALRERLTDGRARGWYDVESDQFLLEGVRLFDGGDLVHRAGTDLSAYATELEEVLRQIASRGARCVLFGGDHSVSLPALRALAPAELGVVHFDAHSDLGYLTSARDLNHGNVVRHILRLPYVKHVLTIGMRGIVPNKPAEAGHDFCSVSAARALRPSALHSMLAQDLPYYISVDIDVLDPSIAPATAASVPDGFSLRELRQLIRGVASGRRIAGADLVEVQADNGSRSTTAAAAAEVALELIHAVWQSPSPADRR